MKVAIYARVSTPEQDPDVQLEPLRTYCATRQWAVFQEYVDVGYSGALDSRPALDELMHAAAARRFRGVLVWKFDRFARSVPKLLESLEWFRSLEIEFVSLTESIDTTTAIGRMVFTFLGAIAAFERDLNRERTRAGMATARAAGKILGRPRVAVTDAEIVRVLDRDPRPSYRQAGRELGVSAAWLSKHIRRAVDKTPG